MKKFIIPALAVLLFDMGGLQSQAQVIQIIGVNFYDSANATAQQEVLPTQTLGGGIGSSTGWYNNVDIASSKPSNVALISSADTLNSATFSINPSGTAHNGNSTTYSTGNNGTLNGATSGLTPEQALYNGYIATANNNYFTTELSLSNITYQSYDVLLYVLTNQYASAKAQLVTGGTLGTAYYLQDGVPFYEGSNLPTSYTLATSTSSSAGTSGANYFAFTGLSGSSQSFDLNADVISGYNNSKTDEFVGFEIVETPEPSTYVLLALGVLGLVVLRRAKVRA